MTDKQKVFIDSVSGGAVSGWKTYGVLPSITIAQAILESGWGESGLTKASNNLFGIKAGSGWTGETIDYPTKEHINGQWVEVVATFRKYHTRNDSMIDHGKFLNENPRYRNVIGETDYRTAAQELQRAGYATAPTYAQTLIDLIDSYTLNVYDGEPPPAPSHPNAQLLFFRAFASKGDAAKLEKILKDLLIDFEKIPCHALVCNVSQGDFDTLVKYCEKEQIPHDTE